MLKDFHFSDSPSIFQPQSNSYENQNVSQVSSCKLAPPDIIFSFHRNTENSSSPFPMLMQDLLEFFKIFDQSVFEDQCWCWLYNPPRQCIPSLSSFIVRNASNLNAPKPRLSLLQFQNSSWIQSQTCRRDFSSLYTFYATEDWTCPPYLNLFSSGKLVVTYSFRSYVFCWEVQGRIVGQIFKYHCTPFTEKKLTHTYSAIDEHNFSMGHCILLSFTFQYRHKICWALWNPLISSAKRAGPNHGTGISNTLCLLFITQTPEI